MVEQEKEGVEKEKKEEGLEEKCLETLGKEEGEDDFEFEVT